MPPTFAHALLGLLLASPILAFPFARSYLIFFVLIIATGLALRVVGPAWRAHPGLRLALAATTLPIVLTTGALALADTPFERVWLEKLALFALAGLMALAVAGLLERAAAVRAIAAAVVSATIAFWLVDGLVQLVFGYDLFGIPASTAHGPARVAIFFSNPTRYGYFVGFLAALPAFWLLARPRGGTLAACTLIAIGATVTLAGGSRYAMVGYGALVLVFALVASARLERRARLAVLAGTPALVALLATGLFFVSPSFHQRVVDTAVLLGGVDRDTLNLALSYRLDIWEPALALAADNWLLGIGPGHMTEAIKPYLDPASIYVTADVDILHTHQVLIEILLGTGAIGLAAFLAYYGWLVRELALPRAAAASFGWGCLLAFVLMWLPFGSHKDFFGSEQVLMSFYLLGLGFGFSAPQRLENPTV